MSLRLNSRLASALVVTSASVVAHAGNDDGVLLGDQAIITAGAVTAIVSDGSSAWYNPAGLGLAVRNQFDVTGSAYGVNIYRVKSLFVLPDGTSANAGMTDWVLVPSVLSFVRELDENWVATFGMFIPRTHDFDLRTSVHQGSQTFAATVSSQLKENDYALAVARRFGPHLRLGVTAAGVYVTRRDFQQVAAGAPDDGAAGFYNGSNSTTVSNYGARLTFGVQWEPAPKWQLGMSIQTPVLTGWSGISRTVIQSTLSSETGAGHFAVDEQDGPVPVWDFTTPVRLRVGLAHWIGKTQILLDGDVSSPIQTPPELPDNTFIDREWVVNARVGALHVLSPAVTAGAGVFTDLSGEERFETNFVGVAFGVTLSSAHTVDGKARDLTFSTTLGGRYAYGWGELNGQNLTLEDGELAAGPIGARTQVHELTFNLGGGVNF